MTGTARLTLALVATLLIPAGASAQTLADEQATEDGEAVHTVDSGTALSDEQAVLEEDEAPPVADDGTDPTERPNTDYFSVGALFRGVIIPDFMQGLFVNYVGGTPVNAGAGAYFNWRKNGFNVILEVWYAGFGNTGFYRGQSSDDTEMEYIESSLGVVFGNFVFGWAFDVTNWFAVELGIGLGFGGMVGNLYRTEAYATGGGYAPCDGPGSPITAVAYCEPTLETRNPSTGRLDDSRVHGGTYQHVDAPNNGPNPFYFGDGGVPPAFFWIDLPRIGVRFRPIRQIQIRIDGGYNVYGFNFGGSLGYGF